jgi:hypothetical protein
MPSHAKIIIGVIIVRLDFGMISVVALIPDEVRSDDRRRSSWMVMLIAALIMLMMR